ncbi:MAG: OsmC family protein [Bacteroidia bacterium]|nr:OsmC family protein [Bacteroidia bacterium]
MNETHTYEVNLKWNNTTRGSISSPVLDTKIEVATPPDFPNGIAGVWSPEHLFVAAINSCLMATFLSIANNSKIEFISYESSAVGTVEKTEGKFLITQVTITPKLVIPPSVSEEHVQRIFERSEKACTVSNSIKSKLNIVPLIIVS